MRDISLADASSTQVDEQRQYRLSDERSFQTHALGSEKHLIVKALSNGCIYSIEHGEILINQVLASPLAGSIHRIYLRIPDERRILSTEIVGPGASSEFTAEADRFCWRGSWQRLSYECQCWLPPLENTWVFHVEIQNTSGKTVLCDAMGLQDIGLATRAQVRNNERYTAQYLDHFAAPHPQLGHLLMTRQNLPQPHGKHPWLLQGCFPRLAGFVTDGFDFFGAGFRETGIPEALSRNTIGTSVRQYEASYTAIQTSRLQIPPGGTRSCSYFSQFSAHHPEPSSTSDIDERAISEFRAACQNDGFRSADSSILSGSKPPGSLFQTAALFEAKTLEETEIRRLFPGPLRHEEFDGIARLSFFAFEDSHHVILKAKELSVERSHGHIMRSGQGLIPDSEVMSCAFYAPGVFASQMALGNTVLGKFISTVRDPLNIIRSGGLRIWVRRQSSDSWELLGVPSAFEMATHFCRWYYKSDHDLLTVTCSSSDEDPAFIYTILSEHHPIEILIGGEISAGPNEYDSSPRMMIDRKRARITIRPDPATLLAEAQPNISFHIVSSTPHAIEALGGDELLGPANSSPVLPYFAVRSHATSRFSLSFLGVFDNPVHGEGLCSKYETLNTNLTRDMPIRSEFWSGINSKFRIAADGCARTSQLQDALVWMARDAVIHLNVPRGLEQANGGAWGVRDVCQGPIEFLIARNLPDVAKKILIELFSQQYRRRGDWPQWFMFPPFQQIQSKTCHGDIVIWPLKALCDYLEETDDGEFLHHGVPYTDDKTLKRGTESETILEHVDRLLKKFRRSFLLGLSLPRFGEGDWDDSLQPKRKVLAEQMVSSWTTALAYQTLSRYAVTLRHFGMDERADAVTQLADAIRADFQRTLMPDGVVAGFAVFGARSDQVEEYLLHPRDKTTGIRYRLISMSRGILSGIFSPAQAEHHLDLVRQHLLAPDGARLMDRPTRYQGGRETIFRRSESASFFGREIGLQYTHAHLRYAEALATMGRADELMQALLTANPIAVTEVVKNARMRQRNCYFSSSDAAFTDRYQASESYDKVRTGEIPVDGGWRIYSSGPGIYTNLVIRHLFGLRRFFDFVEFDPVLPREFREVCCDTIHQSRKVRYRFVAVENSSGSSPISINGTPITSCIRVKNAYRPAGIRIARSEFQHALSHPDNVVQIETQLQREE